MEDDVRDHLVMSDIPFHSRVDLKGLPSRSEPDREQVTPGLPTRDAVRLLRPIPPGRR